MGSTDIFGDQSIHRFKGEIKFLGEEYPIFIGTGDKEHRLTFVLIKDIGYVYVRGDGKVILSSGRSVELGEYEDSNKAAATIGAASAISLTQEKKLVEVTPDMVLSAYERMQWEVRAAHILVKCDSNAAPRDTLAAYNKAIEFRQKILDGEDFQKIAGEYSDDPSASKNRGDLGYFTAFAMVRPFEMAAFTLPAGTVSMPVRTGFGYHIIKVLDKRPYQGEVQIAHIFVKNESEAEDIYNQLKEGEDFSELARKYSIDEKSSANGGILPFFSAGRMIPEFEEAAFSLNIIGELSKPFDTQYGWHIIKLIDKRELESFEKLRPAIEEKLSKWL